MRTNRRNFFKTATMAGVAGASPAAQTGANDRIGVGIIGCGNMGTWNQRDLQTLPSVEIVAACDVYQTNLDRAVQMSGGKARPYRDYRRLLEDRNVQAVVVATPEHWHALMCIDACDAGKDVYVEKPVSHHIRDGRLMVEAARRNNRVVQVGTHEGTPIRWVFTDIEPDSFRWIGESLDPDGRTWSVRGEFRARRLR